MARSPAELFDRPFEDLEVVDVEAILARHVGEGETLFFECKEKPHGDAIAKACAAFANTMGGLLIVGVTDAGQIVGTERLGGEPQLWQGKT